MSKIQINNIYNGDALEILKTFSDKSINCCVTSPPYYGLRDYGVDGQIGLEDTPEIYIDKLVNVFREVNRVLTDDGTLWLNIADSYAGSCQGAGTTKVGEKQKTNKGTNYMNDKTHVSKLLKIEGCKPKDLIGIPWMLAFALRADGWYLRQDIIWQKPNAMPESVRDRCTKSHEYIFLLSKSKKYYFDYEAIKEPCVNGDPNPPRGSLGVNTPNSGRRGSGNKERKQRPSQDTINKGNQADSIPWEAKEFRNKRSVWTVTTKPLREAHFATFPPDLIEPCILAGCPKDGIVLDPFFGSGTVGLVSKDNDRNYIGIDLNGEYCKLAKKRVERMA